MHHSDKLFSCLGIAAAGSPGKANETVVMIMMEYKNKTSTKSVHTIQFSVTVLSAVCPVMNSHFLLPEIALLLLLKSELSFLVLLEE